MKYSLYYPDDFDRADEVVPVTDSKINKWIQEVIDILSDKDNGDSTYIESDGHLVTAYKYDDAIEVKVCNGVVSGYIPIYEVEEEKDEDDDYFDDDEW